MTPAHIGLATLVATIWGVAFVVSKIGLESFTPPQLTALRFVIAAVAVAWLPRPAISWPMLIGIGLTLYAGQFLLQFFGIAHGMPPGLTAVIVQTQALFTVLFAAFFIGDRPNARQVVGMLTALVGLAVIGLTLGGPTSGGGATIAGFALALGSAVSWGVGNILVKRLPKVDMLHLMVWASVVPPLPALALSLALDGPGAFVPALLAAPWTGIASAVYLGLVSTVWAYAVWGRLLHQYPAGAVAPFALLAPCVGAIASALVFGERFGPARLAGIAIMLVGIAIVATSRRQRA